MKGLIKKDFLMIRSNIKILVILFVVYGLMAFKGEMDLSFLLPFMSVLVMTSTFSYDAYNKWDAYAITIPDGRKNSVRAKYLATIMLIILTTIVISILAIITFYAHTRTIDFENILSSLVGALFATVLLQSFMYPTIYKFGLEKARISIFIIVFGITLLIGIISKVVNFSSLLQTLNTLNNYWMIILPLIMIIMLYVSYKISEKIYMKKEY